MSVTVAPKPHFHLPVKSVVVFLVAAAVAATVLVLVNQPWEVKGTTEGASAVPASGEAAAVPKPESWSRLSAHPELLRPAPVAQPAGETYVVEGKVVTEPRHNLVVGTLLGDQPAYVSQPPAPWYPPGAVDNPHPLNFVAGSGR